MGIDSSCCVMWGFVVKKVNVVEQIVDSSRNKRDLLVHTTTQAAQEITRTQTVRNVQKCHNQMSSRHINSANRIFCFQTSNHHL
jgi:hypothetical protein